MKSFPINPGKLSEIYRNSGKQGLIDFLCVFKRRPSLNKIMEEIVDCIDLSCRGEIDFYRFQEIMVDLNEKLYEEVCDFTMDEFNDGKLPKETMSEFLNKLRESKAKTDNSLKE